MTDALTAALRARASETGIAMIAAFAAGDQPRTKALYDSLDSDAARDMTGTYLAYLARNLRTLIPGQPNLGLLDISDDAADPAHVATIAQAQMIVDTILTRPEGVTLQIPRDIAPLVAGSLAGGIAALCMAAFGLPADAVADVCQQLARTISL